MPGRFSNLNLRESAAFDHSTSDGYRVSVAGTNTVARSPGAGCGGASRARDVRRRERTQPLHALATGRYAFAVYLEFAGVRHERHVFFRWCRSRFAGPSPRGSDRFRIRTAPQRWRPHRRPDRWRHRGGRSRRAPSPSPPRRLPGAGSSSARSFERRSSAAWCTVRRPCWFPCCAATVAG